MAHHVAMNPSIAVRAIEAVTPSVDRKIRFEADSSEALFHALDGCELRARGELWHLEIFSVCELGGARYVQLALNGSERHMLTLRVNHDADIRRLIPRLLSWLLKPTFGEVLTII